MRADNTIHLKTAAQRRHEHTRAKAIAAMHELDQAGTALTFESVARQAGISRSWIYTASADLVPRLPPAFMWARTSAQSFPRVPDYRPLHFSTSWCSC